MKGRGEILSHEIFTCQDHATGDSSCSMSNTGSTHELHHVENS